MNLSALLLGAYLVLANLFVVISSNVDPKVVAVLGLVAGILIFINAVHPITIGRNTSV